MHHHNTGIFSAHNRYDQSYDDPLPVAYGGTQLNFYSKQPNENNVEVQRILEHARASSVMNAPPQATQHFNTYPYGYAYPPNGYSNNSQLGLVTEHMLRRLDEARLLTMSELMRRSYGNLHSYDTHYPTVEELQSPIEQGHYTRSRAHLVSSSRSDSAGKDNRGWKGQLKSIYDELLEFAEDDRSFRRSIGLTHFGKIVDGDIEEYDDCFTLKLTFAKGNHYGDQVARYTSSYSSGNEEYDSDYPRHQTSQSYHGSQHQSYSSPEARRRAPLLIRRTASTSPVRIPVSRKLSRNVSYMAHRLHSTPTRSRTEAQRQRAIDRSSPTNSIFSARNRNTFNSGRNLRSNSSPGVTRVGISESKSTPPAAFQKPSYRAQIEKEQKPEPKNRSLFHRDSNHLKKNPPRFAHTKTIPSAQNKSPTKLKPVGRLPAPENWRSAARTKSTPPASKTGGQKLSYREQIEKEQKPEPKNRSSFHRDDQDEAHSPYYEQTKKVHSPYSGHQAQHDPGTRPKREPEPSLHSSVRAPQKKEEPVVYEQESYQQEGTLKAFKPFNVEQDCEALRKAMKGLGTDEDAVSLVMGRRNCQQRQQIIKQYKTMFGKDLIAELKSELSGDYWKAVQGLCYTLPDFDAIQLRNAVKGLGTDDDCVIEIICTRNNESLRLICEAYQQRFNRKLEEDIASDTSGHYQRLLISLLQSNRDESTKVNRNLAKKEAQALAEAGEKKWGTDESKFNSILVSRSYPQLRATFSEYEKLTGHTLDEAVKKELSGDLQTAMLTIISCIKNKMAYFATKLYKAMKGLGTDDDALIRILISRCEIDMVQIKEEFQHMYNQTLGQFFEGDISGDYRNILMLLISEGKLMKK